MSKEILIPKIRFNIFDGNWEKLKLKEVANYIRGSFPQPYTNPEWYDEENGKPFVQVADIGFNLKLNETTKQHISNIAESKSRFVDKGTVIVALQGSIEKSIGRVALTQYPAFFDRTILIFESYKVSVDKKYFAQVIQNLFKIEKERAWGATISTITKSAVSEFIIGIPEEKEQKEIGLFFSKLDDTIFFQQQLLNDHKQLKKAMLQKMFPQKGESVPRVRFAGFTDNWEQRKLGEVSPLRGGFAFQSTKFQLKGIPIIRITNILSNERVGGNYVYYEQQENDSKYSLPDKSAILAMSGATTGKVSVLDNPNNEKIYQNQRVGYFKDLGIVNYTFISTIVKSNLFINQLKSVLVAGAQPNISSKEIDEFYFYFPTEKEEQTKIGDFFKQLDETIVLHEKKLETYQNLKKAMLQKMFV